MTDSRYCGHGFEGCALCYERDATKTPDQIHCKQPFHAPLCKDIVVKPFPGWPLLSGCLLTAEDDPTRESRFVWALHELDCVLQLRDKLAQDLAKGFLNMSQARYSLGFNRVGRAQYPNAMTASSRITLQGNLKDLKFQMVDFNSDDSCGTAGDEADCSTDAVKGSSREIEAELGHALSQTAAKSECNRSQKAIARSPLHWYGYSTSPALRSAQGDFRSALEMAVSLAQAQFELQRAVMNVMDSRV